MQRYIGFMAAGIVAFALLSGVAAQQGGAKKKLPDDAAAAQEQFEEAAARADTEREKKVADARAVLVKTLSSLVSAETRKGNLDGAVAIRELIASGGAAGGKGAPGAFKGTWLVTLSNNGTFRYELADARVVLDVDKTPHPASRVVRKGEMLLAWIPVGGATHVHRYEVHGNYLVCQIWMDARQFDRGSPPGLVGLARRAE